MINVSVKVIQKNIFVSKVSLPCFTPTFSEVTFIVTF